MKRQEQKEERKVYVMIRSKAGKTKPVKLETWRYWEIVGELMWLGVDRFDAYDAARWCAKEAKPGDKLDLSSGVSIEIKVEVLLADNSAVCVNKKTRR